MKVSFWFGSLAVLTLGAISFGQGDDGKKFCQSVIQCYEEAAKLADDCQSQNANRKPANASSTNDAAKCKAAISEKASQLRDKQRQHRQMLLDCLKGRVNEATPVPPKLSNSYIDSMAHFVFKAKCEGGSTSERNTSSPRSKRQSLIEKKSSANATATDGGANNAIADGAGAGGRGSGRGRGKGKGKGRGNGRGKGNGCQKQVHQKQQQCRRVAKCCSEVAYCHLKFELSDLHDQIKQLQLDILEQRRQCQKQQQQSQGASSSVKSASSDNNVFMDSPIEEDEEDDDDNE